MNLLTRLLLILMILPYLNGRKLNIPPPPEICNNAVDDDGDGLIDQNDEDCFCPILKPESFIPNPSFEDQNCCPSTHSALHCATTWIQASAPTSDYFHSCDWTGFGEINIPQPLPDGEGFVGFYDGTYTPENFQPNWKEYVGACLTNPLQADSAYRLQFYVGFLDKIYSPPTEIAIFGTNDCANLPFGGEDYNFGCPTNGSDWIHLGSVSAVGENEWKQLEITIKSSIDLAAVVIGPDCFHHSITNNPYYFLDHLILAENAVFDIEIRANDQPCAANLAFEIPYQEDSNYQWYKDGIAILGATTATLNNPPGAGEYQVKIENQEGCKISKPYTHILPYQFAQTTQTICKGESYLFNNQQLTTPDIYWDTLKTVNNCDSIIRLELQFADNIEKQVVVKIFPKETYQIGSFRFGTPGEYVQTISSNIGCDSTIYLKLDYYSIYIPNAFSPNGDGVNDIFSINGGADLQSISSLNIFNRWGNLMYSGRALSPNVGWDGTINGEKAQEAVYVYRASVLMNDYQERTIYGMFTLVR